MTEKHTYHITPKGEVAVCRAIKRKCPWALATSEQMAAKPGHNGLIQDLNTEKKWSQEEYKRAIERYGVTRNYRFIEDPTIDPLTEFVETEERSGDISRLRRFNVVLDSRKIGNWNHEVRLEHNFFVNVIGQFEHYTTLRGYQWNDSAVPSGEGRMPELIDKIMESGGPRYYKGSDAPKTRDYEIVEDVQLYVTDRTDNDYINSNDEGFTASMTEAKKALESYYAKTMPTLDASKEAELKTSKISNIFKTIESNRAPEKVWIAEKDLPDNGNRNPFYHTKSHDDPEMTIVVNHGSQVLVDDAYEDFIQRRDLNLEAPKFNVTLDNKNGADMYRAGSKHTAEHGESGLSWKLDYAGNNWNLTTVGADGHTTQYNVGADGSGIREAMKAFSEDPYQLGGRDQGPPADQIPAEFRSMIGKNNYTMNSENAVNFVKKMNDRMSSFEKNRQDMLKRREEVRLKKAHRDLVTPKVQFQGTSSSNSDQKKQNEKKKGFFDTLNSLFG